MGSRSRCRRCARGRDLALLTDYFLDRVARRAGFAKTLAGDARTARGRYAWPGNVRELRHAIESAWALADGDVIGLGDLPVVIRTPIIPEGPPGFETSEGLVEGSQRVLQVRRRHAFAA
jgi:DNA-binding NtrC family response regulator